MNAEHMPLHYGNECTATLKGKGNTCSCHYSDNDERTVATYTVYVCMDKVVHWAYTWTDPHSTVEDTTRQYPSFSRNESQLLCLNKKHIGSLHLLPYSYNYSTLAVCTYSPTVTTIAPFRLTQTMPVSLQ